MSLIPDFLPRAVDLADHLEENKVLIIYGARQVGKTTLVRHFLEETTLKYAFQTGDDITFANDFGRCDLEIISKMVQGINLLVIDEAQKIENVGRALKLVVDNFPGIYVIATGSSSFDLASHTSESLTGRKNVVTLFPISVAELLATITPYQLERSFDDLLVYGMYPNVLTYSTDEQKQRRIEEIKNAYLIRDILEFNRVKNSAIVMDLLRLLAYQVCNEVSTVELGRSLGIDHKTVGQYLDLLEKSFVLFSLQGFSRNLRKEVTKMKKYYFIDIGIRNALIANFNSIDIRNDMGQLWENFLITERLKTNMYSGRAVNTYFWRTYDQKEIDLIEERGGDLFGYEFKWSPTKKQSPPRDWDKAYPGATYEIISRLNFLTFIS